MGTDNHLIIHRRHRLVDRQYMFFLKLTRNSCGGGACYGYGEFSWSTCVASDLSACGEGSKDTFSRLSCFVGLGLEPTPTPVFTTAHRFQGGSGGRGGEPTPC